jgi:predicted DNA-binding transcriptional regulator YafY
MDLREIILLVSYVNRHPGITLRELSKRFNRSVGEIRKTLELASLCGLPDYTPFDLIDVDFEGERVYVRFADYLSRPVSLSLSEALAILWGAKILAKGHFSFTRPLGEAVNKIKRAISSELAAEAEKIASQREIVLDEEESVLEEINKCIEKNITAEMEYHSLGRDELTKRIVEPYTVVVQRGKCYLIAFCRLRGDFRQFLVNRIRSFRPTREKFQRKPFDVEKFLTSYSPEEVEIKIFYTEPAARFVRERVGKERREDREDGSTVICLGYGSYKRIIREWVLPFKHQAKIISPAELRKQFLKELQRIKEKYERTA